MLLFAYGEIIALTPNYLTEINYKHQEIGLGMIKEGFVDAVYILSHPAHSIISDIPLGAWLNPHDCDSVKQMYLIKCTSPRICVNYYVWYSDRER